MARDECDRMVADIANAIQQSDLLSLLHPSPTKRHACLSEISQSILDERVKPIRAALENINAEKLLGLEIIPTNGIKGPRIRDGVYCRPICDQIRQKWHVNDDDNDVSMEDDENRNSIVRYLHIAEVPDEYTIGIFVFGPHERIPLHDHPEMCVLSRVLYGDLKRWSLDLDRKGKIACNEHLNGMILDMDDETDIQEEEDPSESSFNILEKPDHTLNSSSFFSALSRSATWVQQNLLHASNSSAISMDSATDEYPEGTKLAYRNAMDILEAPNVASLYPYEGNLHEFVAGPHGAAVLDVLLPPYDDERKRDCTFYNIRELPQKEQPKSRKFLGISPRGKKKKVLGNHDRDACLIIPTGQPENFHCISGRYRDLGEIDDYEDDE